MAINPAIAMSVQPMQVKDLMQSYGQLAQIQNAQNQNALAQYQLGAAQRAEDQALALGKAYAGAVNPDTGDVDQNLLIKTLAGGAGAPQIPAALKATTEAQSAKATLQKTQQEAQKLAFERARTLVTSIKDQPGYDAWKGYVTKDFPGLAGVLPDQYSPENIRAIALDADKLYEQHFVPQTLGKTNQVLGINKYGNGQATVVPGSVAQVTMSPAEEAANKVALGNLAVNQGQLRVAQQNASKPVYKDGQWVLAPSDMKPGEVREGVNPVAVKDATEALRLIDQATDIIPRATGSYLGNFLDTLSQAVGYAPQGARATAQLQAIEGMLVSKMPKMSGPQSDKDVALYKQMAGNIGNPNVPASVKQEAIQAIKEIQMRYAGQTPPITSKPKGGATPAQGGIDTSNPLLR